MPLITRLMLQNFKKFSELDPCFSADRNILVGDNEPGKSTNLLALDHSGDAGGNHFCSSRGQTLSGSRAPRRSVTPADGRPIPE